METFIPLGLAFGQLDSPEHSPGASPRGLLGQGGVPSRALAPEGCPSHVPHVYRRHEDGVWTRRKGTPEGCSAPLTAGSPPWPSLMAGEARGEVFWLIHRKRLIFSRLI
jgi:hypothetical protein